MIYKKYCAGIRIRSTPLNVAFADLSHRSTPFHVAFDDLSQLGGLETYENHCQSQQ
jgi:hypothetical protein